MELDELEIGQRRTGPPGQRESASYALVWAGSPAEDPARATGREDDSVSLRHRTVLKLYPAGPTVLKDDADGPGVDARDPRFLGGSCGERLQQDLPGGVSAGVVNARRGVPAFASRPLVVEDHPDPPERDDRRGCLVDEHVDRGRIAEPRSRGDRVCRV